MKSEETNEEQKNYKKCRQTKYKDGFGFQRCKNAYLSIAYHIAQMFFGSMNSRHIEFSWLLLCLTLYFQQTIYLFCMRYENTFWN